MAANLLKSSLHNVGVVIVGLGVAHLGRMVDLLFGVSAFVSMPKELTARNAQPFRWKSRAADPRCRTWRGVAPIMRRNVRVKCAASENPAA
jgi:hypothetical protein